MPVGATTNGWMQLPSGVCISTDRTLKGGEREPFTLHDAIFMDKEAFNKEAEEYGIHINKTDDPIDRMVKYSIFLARKKDGGSRMFSNENYVDMLLEVAAGKGKEPVASVYYNITKGVGWDAIRDVLEFQGKVNDGPNKGKHEVRLLRFDDNGALQPIDEILVAPQGCITALGARRKYPIETSETQCRIHNIETSTPDNFDADGLWYVGKEPEKGEQRVVLHIPYPYRSGLFGVDISRTRSCGWSTSGFYGICNPAGIYLARLK